MSPTPAIPEAFAPVAEPCAPTAQLCDLVLLIEDDDSVAGLVKCILARSGLRVVRARDGAEAERQFREYRELISMVITDCHLPDTHGASLGQKLRHLSPQLPLLLTSGRDQTRMVDLLSGTGPTRFLAKPFFPAQVERAVTCLLAAIA